MTKITDEVLVATWYLFHPIDDPAKLAEVLRAPTFSRDIKGLIIVATEGVNGTIAGDRQSVHRFVEQLKAHIHADHLTPRFSMAERVPMHRFKVLLRPEIVTLGDPDANPQLSTGQHIDPDAWNDVINDPDTVVIDTRKSI